MNSDFIQTTKPCDELGCRGGFNAYNDFEPCGVCHGTMEIEIEVHETCGLTESECKCFEDSAVEATGTSRRVA